MLSELRRLIATLPPDYESPEAQHGAEEVRTVSTPVFGADGAVVLVLTVINSRAASMNADLPRYVTRLRQAAEVVTTAMGGSYPPPGAPGGTPQT